jgi:hypothetical protein
MRKTTTEILDFVQNDDLEGLQPRKDKLRGFFPIRLRLRVRMTTLKVSGRMTIFEYQRQTLLNGERPGVEAGPFYLIPLR